MAVSKFLSQIDLHINMKKLNLTTRGVPVTSVNRFGVLGRDYQSEQDLYSINDEVEFGI